MLFYMIMMSLGFFLIMYLIYKIGTNTQHEEPPPEIWWGEDDYL